MKRFKELTRKAVPFALVIGFLALEAKATEPKNDAGKKYYQVVMI